MNKAETSMNRAETSMSGVTRRLKREYPDLPMCPGQVDATAVPT